VGDCREMLQTGSPIWSMELFGALALTGGLLAWHRLGSFRSFYAWPTLVKPWWTGGLYLALFAYVIAATTLSSV